MPQEITHKKNSAYTQEDEVAVFIAWRLEGENAAAASRVTGVPAPTVRAWVQRWQRDGFTDGELQLIEATAQASIVKANKAITMIMDRIIELVPESTNLGQLVTAFDKMNAHIRLAQGKATVIREDRKIDSDQISDSLKKYLDSMGPDTAQRANEIVIDVELVDQPLKRLNAQRESTQPKD